MESWQGDGLSVRTSQFERMRSVGIAAEFADGTRMDVPGQAGLYASLQEGGRPWPASFSLTPEEEIRTSGIS